jgi:hypothetical protein
MSENSMQWLGRLCWGRWDSFHLLPLQSALPGIIFTNSISLSFWG